MSTENDTNSAVGKVSLLNRLHAWWEGDDVEADDAAAGDLDALSGDPDSTVEGVASWPEPRLAAAQRLFGEGCTFPGSEEAIMQLIEPMQLDAEKSVLDITAGIGTATRVIAREFGCKVEGLQHDPAQMELAVKFAEKAGLADNITIREGSLGNCDIEPGSQDAVFGRAALLGLKEKDTIFNDIWALLKPGGQILLAEFAAKNATGAKDDMAEWAKFEKMQPYLVTVEQIKQGLSASHLDVHQADDISEAFCNHITHGLADLTGILKQGTIPKNQRSWMMWEVELWARRVLVLQGGNIGFYLFHASKGDE